MTDEKTTAARGASPLWNRRTAGLTPYVPGEQPRSGRWIKLNTNENPYGPSPEVRRVLAGFDLKALSLYPDPGASALREAIASEAGVSPDCVFVGNGSDEVLALAFQTFFEPASSGGRAVLVPEVSYSFYPVYAALYDVPLTRLPLSAGWRVDIEPYLEPSGGVVLANPNAPTGVALPRAAIEQIAAIRRDRVVLIDEAYIDFGGETAVPLTARYSHLLVVRTFSKSYGLAGLRVGYAIGHPRLIEGLCRVRDSFNSYTVDRLAQVLARAAILDWRYFRQCVDLIIETREAAVRDLAALGFEVTPSMANFLWVRHPDVPAAWLADQLKQNGILIRHFSDPLLADHLRITIGLPADMDRLKRVLARLLRAFDQTQTER